MDNQNSKRVATVSKKKGFRKSESLEDDVVAYIKENRNKKGEKK